MVFTRRSNLSTKEKRIVEKKRQFKAKIEDNKHAVLNVKKTSINKKKSRRQKILKAYDLSALSEFLPELQTPQPSTFAADLKLNCKSRQKMILKEGKQLSAVLNHPTFKLDPLAAIHQHLQMTQPVVDEKPDKKKKKINEKKKKKKKSKSSSSGIQSMDV